MIVGVGIDIVDTSRVQSLIERHGERFERRVFTPAEISYCRRKRHPFPHYSARFAAKEAAAKALGTGFGRGIRFTDIAIENEGDAPRIVLRNRAREIADELGVSRLHVSLSHERSSAVAMVVLEAAG
ncbi:MAG: holo-ACP synthase [Desulfomonilia bacterium]|jgi:holo-[acyl-carrier protein] synthase